MQLTHQAQEEATQLTDVASYAKSWICYNHSNQEYNYTLVLNNLYPHMQQNFAISLLQ
jgi:hypothetical protein